MPATPTIVDIHLEDTTLLQNPVVGALVRFYDSGDVFITEETTDSLGNVSVLLDGDTPAITYHVRAYKPGCSFGGPWSIDVLNPPGIHPLDNDWTMPVNVFEVPNSPTPGMCRAAGYMVGPDNKPFYPASVRFELHKLPEVFYGALVGGHAVAYADETGYVQIDLIRGAEYEVVVSHWLESSRKVVVPDRGGVVMADLIFPIPMVVDWSVTSPLALTVGQTEELAASVLGSDYNNWKLAKDYIEWSSDNPAICSVGYGQGDVLQVRAGVAGTTTLRAKRSSKAFRVFPVPALVGDTLGVVVT